MSPRIHACVLASVCARADQHADGGAHTSKDARHARHARHARRETRRKLWGLPKRTRKRCGRSSDALRTLQSTTGPHSLTGQQEGGARGGMEPRWPKQAPNAIEPQAHGSSAPVVSVPWSTQAPAAVPAGTSLQVTTPLQLHKSKGPRAPQASSSPLLPTSPPIPQRQPISTDAPGQSHHQHPHAHGTEQRSRGWLMYLWLYSLQRTRSVRSYGI